jgi:hypothetical protein
MAPSSFSGGHRLQGKSIFLSASVPTKERQDEYERVPEAPLRIEEAVICVARAIFVEGGTLVFGAHPSISPLIARVIDHYYIPPSPEPVEIERRDQPVSWKNPSIDIYQSNVWKKKWADATKMLENHAGVKVHWTEAVRGESINTNIKDRPQAPKSMEIMRRAMIEKTQPIAMIAIGGMKGVKDEAKLFAEICPSRPIFSFATTGGSASLLSKEESLHDVVQVVDANAKELVRKFWEREREFSSNKGNEPDREYYVPYAFIAQQLVDQLLGGSTNDNREFAL